MTCFSNRKISDTILTLRAATVLNEQISFQEVENQESLRLREIVGDFGVAIFNPLLLDGSCHSKCGQSEDSNYHSESETFFRTLSLGIPEQEKCSVNNPLATSPFSHETSSCTSSSSEEGDYIFDHEIFPVQIQPPDDSSELSYAPYLLDLVLFQEIVDYALPRNLRMYKWKRIFSIAKDGDLLFSMLEKCAPFKHTLLVLKTTKGNILGGFASEHWKAQDGFDKRHSYFGTGTCFLFSDYPENPEPKRGLSFHKWSGVNDYCQICDPDIGKIAMGGGEGDFGLIIADSFLRGSSGHCATFNNPPLIPGIAGTFDVLGFEVYGMMPLIPTVSKSVNHKYSQRSLLATRY